MSKELNEMLKSELIELAESLGLETDGTKAVLIERIEAAQVEEAPAEEEVVEEEAPAEEEVVEEVAEEPVEDAPMKDLLTEEPDETMDDKEFIEWAYQSVLKRKADQGGLMHYLNGMRLRKWSRDRVLNALKESDEAKALGELDGKRK